MSASPADSEGRKFLPGIPAEHHGNGERILHIDDEPAVTTTFRRMLEKLGYRVESFNAPHAAADRFLSAPDDFDLVLTDMMMPGMDGIELARTIRSLRPGLPIVLHSAYSARYDSVHIHASGICEIMAKPAHLAHIAATLRRALSPISPNP